MFNYLINENLSDHMTIKEKKTYADRYAEALHIMRNEKDPIKREKMNARIAMNVFDFSDL